MRSDESILLGYMRVVRIQETSAVKRLRRVLELSHDYVSRRLWYLIQNCPVGIREPYRERGFGIVEQVNGLT